MNKLTCCFIHNLINEIVNVDIMIPCMLYLAKLKTHDKMYRCIEFVYMLLSMTCGYKCIICLVMIHNETCHALVSSRMHGLWVEKKGKWKEERVVLCLVFIGLDIIIITYGMFETATANVFWDRYNCDRYCERKLGATNIPFVCAEWAD